MRPPRNGWEHGSTGNRQQGSEFRQAVPDECPARRRKTAAARCNASPKGRCRHAAYWRAQRVLRRFLRG